MSSQVQEPDRLKIMELQDKAEAILEEERGTGWTTIFILLAFARQFVFYLILITFWINVF